MMSYHVIMLLLSQLEGSGENSDWQDITTAVSEKSIADAIEDGKLSIDHSVTGRYIYIPK